MAQTSLEPGCTVTELLPWADVKLLATSINVNVTIISPPDTNK
jgi:hypothetical protein